MKKNISLLAILLCSLLFISTTMQPTQENSSFVIIINNNNPVINMSASQVKLTYLRKITKRWKELNKNIVPVDKKGDSEIRKSFLSEILQMTADEVTRYYTEREYQNAEAPPVKLSSDAEIINFVENNIGAIGYVAKSSVAGNSKVKIVYGQ